MPRSALRYIYHCIPSRVRSVLVDRPLRGLRLLSLYPRSRCAVSYAARHHLTGLNFYRYGRQIGRSLMLSDYLLGLQYWLHPVVAPRYFEFSFAQSCLPERPGRCLDVSSPFLFSFFVAHNYPECTIRIDNPDNSDTMRTEKMVTYLRIGNIETSGDDVAQLANQRKAFDCIWSLSVIEHIDGKYDDRAAMRLMYDALKPGGRLVLTFPVDRKYWVEYRDCDPYGTQPSDGKGRFFYQRFYDRAAIEERLIATIGQPPCRVSWQGERLIGQFDAWERQRRDRGISFLVDDPSFMTNQFRSYDNWEDMPGMGICGLMFEKTKVAPA